MYDSSFKMADNNKIDKLEMESILIFKHVAKILNSEQVQQLKKGFEASLSLVTNCEVNYAYTTTPLAVELSSDGESFQEVRRFTGRGGEGQRWVYRGDGQVARFVRVRNVAGHGIALCEIEVYGPAK